MDEPGRLLGADSYSKAATDGKTMSAKIKSLLLLRPRTTTPPPSRIGQILPLDILYELADYLASSDLLNLSLTSSYIRNLLLPALYDTVVLKSSRACSVTLSMLLQRPDISHYIRKLAVRPNYYLAWPKPDGYLSEDWVITTLVLIADTMPLLHTFDWDGLEMPSNRLWDTLRDKCPALKTVYSNIGYSPLDPDCALFNFSGLTSFSLTVRHNLDESNLFPEQETLPNRLWDMLLNRCPDMQDLTISSFSSSTRLLDVDRLCTPEAYWPNLNSLTLGSFGYNDDFDLNSPADDDAFGAFLSKHTNIKYLRLSWNFKRWMSPDSIPLLLHPTALPNLGTFVGIHQQLAVLPKSALSSIEVLDLTCEPLFAGRLQGERGICATLVVLTSLTSLDLWIHIPEFEDHNAFFKELMQACPKLTELHFMCTTSFGVKPLLCLASHLSLLPHLRIFCLTKGHKYVGDDSSMLRTALRIIKGSRSTPRNTRLLHRGGSKNSNPNPELKQVNIRWAREKCPNHLKQEGTYDIVRRWDTVSGEQHSDGAGGGGDVNVIVGIEAYEKGVTVLGKMFTRRYQYNKFPVPASLRPRRPRLLASSSSSSSTLTPSPSALGGMGDVGGSATMMTASSSMMTASAGLSSPSSPGISTITVAAAPNNNSSINDIGEKQAQPSSSSSVSGRASGAGGGTGSSSVTGTGGTAGGGVGVGMGGGAGGAASGSGSLRRALMGIKGRRNCS
ncbi:hypothetical protein D9757_005506 [Collybiopsis confluens]|uniref:F-box domain-containing protein n=1 Tax=Collybiopsis confluens TaxID=2823264 RepID=A0A8H5HMG1_9AGAR|nr:hypothetical protein D9757_005506 [Collybiopsis confluens]